MIEDSIQFLANHVSKRQNDAAKELLSRIDKIPRDEWVNEITTLMAREFRAGINMAISFHYGD